VPTKYSSNPEPRELLLLLCLWSVLVGQQSHLDTEYCCCCPYTWATALVEVNKGLGYHCNASVVKKPELASSAKKKPGMHSLSANVYLIGVLLWTF